MSTFTLYAYPSKQRPDLERVTIKGLTQQECWKEFERLKALGYTNTNTRPEKNHFQREYISSIKQRN